MDKQERELIARYLYNKHKDKFNNWTENQFAKWCDRKIKTENVNLTKKDNNLPWTYWNLKIENESPTDDICDLCEQNFDTNLANSCYKCGRNTCPNCTFNSECSTCHEEDDTPKKKKGRPKKSKEE